MKKNGCKLVFTCDYDCKHYKTTKDEYSSCKYNNCSGNYDLCTNKAAQREAMKHKTRWTRKEPRICGFYYVKLDGCNDYSVSRYFNKYWYHIGSTMPDSHSGLVEQGYRRSVKPIEED